MILLIIILIIFFFELIKPSLQEVYVAKCGAVIRLFNYAKLEYFRI